MSCEPSDSEVTVGLLAYEMAQFEIHFARNCLASALVKAQVYARYHPQDAGAQALAEVLHDLKQKTEDALLVALRDPQTRRGRIE